MIVVLCRSSSHTLPIGIGNLFTSSTQRVRLPNERCAIIHNTHCRRLHCVRFLPAQSSMPTAPIAQQHRASCNRHTYARARTPKLNGQRHGRRESKRRIRRGTGEKNETPDRLISSAFLFIFMKIDEVFAHPQFAHSLNKKTIIIFFFPFFVFRILLFVLPSILIYILHFSFSRSFHLTTKVFGNSVDSYICFGSLRCALKFSHSFWLRITMNKYTESLKGLINFSMFPGCLVVRPTDAKANILLFLFFFRFSSFWWPIEFFAKQLHAHCISLRACKWSCKWLTSLFDIYDGDDGTYVGTQSTKYAICICISIFGN